MNSFHLINTTHEDFTPFFIVGAPRSGTTLLTVLLDRHPQVSVPPETFFFHVFSGVKHFREKPDYDWLIRQYLDNSYMSAMNLDRAKLMERLRNYNPDHSSFFRCALEEYAAGQNKRISGEKTATHIKYVKTILDWYPNAKIIWLVRDGRDVAMAMMRLFHKNIRSHCCNWRMSVQLGLQWERHYPENFYKTRFEDIILNPQSELQKIGNFLRIDYQNCQLDTTLGSGAVTEGEMYYKERALKPMDPNKIGEWKRIATPEQIHIMHHIMGSHLQLLGYQNDFEDSSLEDKIYNYLVQIPFDVAFNTNIHPFLHSYRIKLRRFLGKVRG